MKTLTRSGSSFAVDVSSSPSAYAHFTANRNGLHVTIYEKGPKVLVQGNGPLGLVDSVLGPLIGAGMEGV